MSMMKISLEQLKHVTETNGLKPCKVRGTNIVNLRKEPSERFEDIGWEEFQETLNLRGLAVYKATGSDFLKIMKDHETGIA